MNTHTQRVLSPVVLCRKSPSFGSLPQPENQAHERPQHSLSDISRFRFHSILLSMPDSCQKESHAAANLEWILVGRLGLRP